MTSQKQTNHSSDTNLLNCFPNPRKRQDWKLEDNKIDNEFVIRYFNQPVYLEKSLKEFLRKCENEAEFDTCLNKMVIDLDKLKKLTGKSLVEKEEKGK